MGPIGRRVHRLGSRRVTVRGTISRINPVKTAFWGLIKSPMTVEIRLDDNKLSEINDRYDANISHTLIFMWRDDDPKPEIGMRVWTQFALAGPLEEFIGAVAVAVADTGFVEDESFLYGNETPPPQPLLPNLLRQPA